MTGVAPATSEHSAPATASHPIDPPQPLSQRVDAAGRDFGRVEGCGKGEVGGEQDRDPIVDLVELICVATRLLDAGRNGRFQ